MKLRWSNLLLVVGGGAGSSSGTTAGWSLDAAEKQRRVNKRLRNVVCDNHGMEGANKLADLTCTFLHTTKPHAARCI